MNEIVLLTVLLLFVAAVGGTKELGNPAIVAMSHSGTRQNGAATGLALLMMLFVVVLLSRFL